MNNGVGKWQPAWGPEPTWRGPAKPTVRKRYQLVRISCPCTPEVHVVRAPVGERYACADCGREITVERVARPRPTSVHPGERYGRLVVEEVIRRGKAGCLAFCRCDCGETKTVIARHLREGRTKSCGCLRRGPAPHPWDRSYK